MAEWLRRQTRNLVGSALVGSNPADVVPPFAFPLNVFPAVADTCTLALQVSCVYSTRVVFNPSKVKIRVRVPMDAKPVIFFSPSFPRDEWIFGIPYTMVVNLRLDGRAVQGAGFRHQSLRRRGFESHSNQSTFFLFTNQWQNFILALAQHERAGTVPPSSVGRAQDS